ncbi:transporter substrate-binding domain-containing protein [Oligoflexus tunisiensis]|uniref:transporter substrate-binding domain-containing protein n=1 Tax=Oligoflexus tunisiensis TaxID=708132 RepID=UPI001C408BCE|nr:transporter substrate-binding domain-containing protein [Oligoflexus tunisiensis]
MILLGFTLSSSTEFRSIKLGYVDFPPFTYKHKGEPAGLLINDAKRVMNKVGLRWASTELYPAARLFKMLKSGEVGMWLGIELHPEHIAYTKHALAVLELNVWTLKDAKQPVVKTVEDLKPYRLALIGGYGYGGWGATIRASGSGYRWIDLSDRQQAFKFLQRGRADILLDYKRPLMMSLPPDQARQLQRVKVKELPAKIGISKAYPRYAELIAALDAEMKKEGKKGPG